MMENNIVAEKGQSRREELLEVLKSRINRSREMKIFTLSMLSSSAMRARLLMQRIPTAWDALSTSIFLDCYIPYTYTVIYTINPRSVASM